MSGRGSGRPDDRGGDRGTSNSSMHNTEAGNTGFGSGQISPQTHDRANRSATQTTHGSAGSSKSGSRLRHSGEDTH